MKVLVTAGSTQVPIDQVRSISNIFKGQTGWNIAEHFSLDQGEEVTLVTSNVLGDLPAAIPGFGGVLIKQYRTFDELATILEKEVQEGSYDVIVHSAAISDYKVAQVLDGQLRPLDKSKKVSSQHQKMYLELVQTPKLVDLMRDSWSFKGVLVKFKLQVGISDAELLDIARASRTASKANLIVANCLEWSRERAYIIGEELQESVTRAQLPERLYALVTQLRAAK